jgi:hypothetical protein
VLGTLYFLSCSDISQGVEIGHFKVIVKDIVIGVKRQSNSLLSIVKREGKVELRMRVHSAGRCVNLDIVNDGDVTKWTPLQGMRYSEVQEKLRYQRTGTSFNSRGMIIIPIAVWANKAVLAKAATKDRSATMAAGGGDLSIYINRRLENRATRR